MDALIKCIRLDIPYQTDATLLRFIAIYASNNELKIYESPPLNSILAVIKQLDEMCKNNFRTDDSTLLVYPLDDRIGLAHNILDTAKQQQWRFGRNISSDCYPGVLLKCSFELDETGSTEDVLNAGSAQQRIFELIKIAQDAYQSSNLLAALSATRQALQLSYLHFGWASPGIAYSLGNFGHVVLATGNQENIFELSTAINRMLYQWDLQTPQKEEWEGAEGILEQMIQLCHRINYPSYSERLIDFKGLLFS